MGLEHMENYKPQRKQPDLAIFLRDLDGGGAERVMTNLAIGFSKRRLSVDVILVSARGPYLSLIPPEVNLIVLNRSRLSFAAIDLVRYLKRNRPKVLLSALEHTNIIAILARKLARVPTVVGVTVHNLVVRNSTWIPANHVQIKTYFDTNIVKIFYPWADHVIAVSQAVANSMIRLGIKETKVTTIYNPIITPDVLYLMQQTIHHPWFSAEQAPVIIAVGRLHIDKCYQTLMEAFSRLRRNRPARLIILGEGDERAKLVAFAKTLGISDDIAMPGFVDNPYVYMAKSSVLVVSSRLEGFSNVLVEAMASGTPVVATDCGGPSEILANGLYGKLVPIGNVEALAEAIESTLTSPPDQAYLKQRAQDFSVEKIVRCYEELLFQYSA